MSKVYFKYGTMGSSKTLDLLRTNYNYIEGGKRTFLITSSIDDRYGVGKITSRVGLSENAHAINANDRIIDVIGDSIDKIDVILIDEAQLLSSRQVKELVLISEEYNIPVIAYGLKNTFNNELFEGSYSLMVYADKIEEIKSMCVIDGCNNKANYNLRFKHGKPVFTGKEIEIGGNDTYKQVCRGHYLKYSNNLSELDKK